MAGSLPELSLKEKVLLWLVHVEDHGGDDPGIAATQVGIANATGLSRGHVSRTVTPLLDAGLVSEEAQRVTGFSRRLKGYRVTQAGRAEHERLLRSLATIQVEVRRAGRDPDKAAFGEVAAPLAQRRGWWPLVDQLYEHGFLELEGERHARPTVTWLRELSDAPPAGRFVGRSRELELVREWLAKSNPLFILEGPGGQGKTTLVGNAVRAAEPRRHVAWIRITDWTTVQQFVDQVDRVLGGLGRPGGRLAADDPAALVEHFGRRMRDLPLLVILDDCQKAGPPVQRALEALTQVTREARQTKLVLIGREVSLSADFLRAAERHTLSPLGAAAADRLLGELGVAPESRADIVAAAQGNPLFLELLARTRDSSSVPVDFYRFLAQDLAAGLPRGHLDLLKWASALRVPEDMSFWGRLGIGSPAAFAELQRASLLKARDDGRYDMHDIVRSAFYGHLTFAERRRIHGALASAYQPGRGAWTGVPEYLHHLVRAGRRDEAVRWVLRNQTRLIERARQLFESRTGRGGGPAG